MRVGFVVPRYGTEVLGGSEYAARMLAERLVARPGFDVEIFTTCGLDMSWEDSYAQGTSRINGVTVHRFSARGRSPDFASFPENPLRHPMEEATRESSMVFCEKQGPVCPAMVDAAEASACDIVAFYPYLYWPTVTGVSRLGNRAILHPAAHDEAVIRLPIYREVFAGASALVYHTDGERELVLSLFPVAEKPQIVLGLGIETHDGDQSAARQSLGFDPEEISYICCIGRVDRPKGTALLADLFLRYKSEHPGPLRLVLVGQVVDRPPAHPDIVVTGPVGEGSKWGILEGSLGLVSPSPNESFSLVLLEAWKAGKPVLVNGACAATREHCERSGGGLVFGGPGSTEPYEGFERALLRWESGETDEMAAAGRAYAEARFGWPVLIDRYTSFLESTLARRSQDDRQLADPLAP